MQRRALAEHFGDEIIGIDLREPVEGAVADELRTALSQRLVLVVRGQRLTGPEQVSAAALFGEPVDEVGDRRRYVHVSNVRDDGVLGEGKPLLFHSDNAFTPEPLAVVTLYGHTIGEGGAPTCFAGAQRAAALLPEELRAELTGAEALHLSGFAGGWYRYRDDETEPHHPRAVHPVLLPNPRTGRPALFVSEQQTDRILGWDPDRGEAVLTALFEVLYDDDNVYRHEWRAGDLVVWDNRALQHGRPAIAGSGERTLRRVALVDREVAGQHTWAAVSLAAEGKSGKSTAAGR